MGFHPRLICGDIVPWSVQHQLLAIKTPLCWASTQPRLVWGRQAQAQIATRIVSRPKDSSWKWGVAQGQIYMVLTLSLWELDAGSCPISEYRRSRADGLLAGSRKDRPHLSRCLRSRKVCKVRLFWMMLDTLIFEFLEPDVAQSWALDKYTPFLETQTKKRWIV